MSSYRTMVSMLLRVALPILVICGMASLAAAAVADHLIITEFMAKTRNPYTTFGSPFIEVANPTGSAIDLSHVYITDGTQSPTGLYYNITLSDLDAASPGGGVGGDFHAKFPDGYSLAAGASLVISINGSQQFNEAYGQDPDFELFEDGAAPDAIPEMVEAFPGAINAGLGSGSNVPVLSDLSESLILYTWNGEDELVEDLDYVIWGTNTAVRIDKTGVVVGSSSYLADTAVESQETAGTATVNFRKGYRRVDADEGTETTSGGNGVGVDGDDETSENMATTWNFVDFQSDGHGVPAAPATYFKTAPIVTSGVSIPEIPYDGQAGLLSVAAATEGTLTDVLFYISVDGGSFGSVNGELQDDDSWTVPVAGQSEGTVVSWYAILTNSAGGVSTYPSAAPLYNASYTVRAIPDLSLMITEVCINYAANEFVEIWNPLSVDVDLSNYYLTDAVYYETGYWNIGRGATAENIGGGTFADFQARFPDGYTIAAGDTIVISIAGSADFSSEYGFLPSLELFEDGMMADQVPDMRPVFPNSIESSDSTPSLSNFLNSSGADAGEIVILYYYEEGDDLATDVDMFFWGNAANFRVDKSGITIGGSTYQDDTPISNQHTFSSDVTFPQTYQRIDWTQGDQVSTGGNGFHGSDETSENFNETFAKLEADPSRPGDAAGTGPDAIELTVEAKTFMPTWGENFPIRFISMPRSETKIRIFDMEGRLVRTLFDNRTHGTPSVVPGDYSTVLWDGRNTVFERVKAGMYIVHLSVVEKSSGDEYTKTAPVVVSTRLSE